MKIMEITMRNRHIHKLLYKIFMPKMQTVYSIQMNKIITEWTLLEITEFIIMDIMRDIPMQVTGEL